MSEEKFVSSHTKTQRVLAIIAVALLALLTITDLVLAIIGAPKNIFMLFIILTIFIPIILFFFIKMLKKKHPENEDIKVPGEK